MTTAKVELPRKLVGLFSGKARYRVAYGGRGSAKTRSFALMTAVKAYKFAEEGISGQILCGREFMNSLEDSSMEEVKQAIASYPFLNDYFEIGEKYIRTKNKLVWYTFCGLRTNLDSIKSKARILLAWVDEAESVSAMAWQKLTPTVREGDSEIYVSYNPEVEGSATDVRFRQKPSPNAKVVEINYTDNPWFPAVLEQERLDDQQLYDDATYSWIWEGQYRQNSESQILADKYVIKEFEPTNEWDGPYFGIDWGFSQDPTAGVKMWIFEKRLYVEYEAGKVGIENDHIASFMIKRLPDIEKHTIRADSARPETISHVKSSGDKSDRESLPMIQSVEKWAGSVEDGIAHLRSYVEIVIHPRCKEFISECRKYSYKVDKNTGDVMTVIIDKNNHYIDAARYALAPLIRKRRGIFG